MTTQSVPAPAALTREAPSLGGFNVTVLRLEIRRLLRNRRTVIFVHLSLSRVGSLISGSARVSFRIAVL